MDLIDNVRRKTKLVYTGYSCVKQKNLADIVFSCECEKQCGQGKGFSKCKAKINVKDGTIISNLHNHVHLPDKARAEVLHVRNNVKKRAMETPEP